MRSRRSGPTDGCGAAPEADRRVVTKALAARLKAGSGPPRASPATTYSVFTAYDDTLRVLDRAIELDSENPLQYALKGRALGNLGVRRARKRLQACKLAVQLEPENLRWQQALADTLLLMEDGKQEGIDRHRLMVEEAKKKVDADFLALRGWSHYRLQQWEEAMRLFGKALYLRPDLIHVQFDLALAATCSGRYAFGLRNYRQGIELASGKNALTRRGLLYVARRELEEAKASGKLAEEWNVEKAHRELSKAYMEARCSTNSDQRPSST